MKRGAPHKIGLERRRIPESPVWDCYGPRAEHLFVVNQLEVQAIADQLKEEWLANKRRGKQPPSRGTLQRWKRQAQWIAMRRNRSHVNRASYESLYETANTLLNKIQALIETPGFNTKEVKSLMDTWGTMMNRLEKTDSDKIYRSTVMITLQSVADDLAVNDPAAAVKFAERLDTIAAAVLQRQLLTPTNRGKAA